MKRDPELWTTYNILLLAIGLEHIIIGLKAVIALVIPDVPKQVKVAEERRKVAIESALKEMDDYKKKGDKDLEEEVK